MEVTTWSRNGIVLLRLQGGRAIYFHHNGETPNGSLQIGIVTNFVEGQGFRYGTSASFVQLYENGNLDGTVAGYSKIETRGSQFTFGVSGFDVYARYNGVEFIRFKQFSHVERGGAAMQANRGYGFRDLTFRLMTDSSLYSSIDCKCFDPRDFGGSSLTAIGSINAGSRQLNLASNPGFKVGDSIIVEIGGERGIGRRGTLGVGGAWPAQSYLTPVAMNSDTTQAPNTYAWIEADGNVWQWNSGKWARVTDYYLAKAAPKSLVGQITNISGTTLTLDTMASTNASFAKIYKDNWSAFNLLLGDSMPGALLPSRIAVRIPAGSFAFSRKLALLKRVGWTIEGAGADQTTLLSPYGVRSQAVEINEGHDNVIQNLTLRGNARFQGYMLAVDDTGPAPGERMYPPGILFSSSDRGVVRNVKVVDVFMDAVGTSYSNDVWVHNCTSVMTDGLQRYVQWMFQWADSAGGGCVDCTVISPVLIAGFETFRSNGVTFTRPVGVNAVMASNSSGNFLFDSPNLTIRPNSQLSVTSFSAHNPIININTNIQPPSPAIEFGGEIRNPTIYEPLPIDVENDTLAGIVVNLHNPNVKIMGTYPTGTLGTLTLPNWQAPSTLHGAVGVNSTAENTTVSGIRVIGSTDAPWDHNIGLTGIGSVCNNSIADRIHAPTQFGNLANRAWTSLRR